MNKNKTKKLWITMLAYDLASTNTLDFYARASKYGIELRLLVADLCKIVDGKLYYLGELILEKPDIILARDKVFYKTFANYIYGLGARVINIPPGRTLGFDKYSAHKFLEDKDVLQPKTIRHMQMCDYQDVVAAVGDPFVAKTIIGAGGTGVFLIENEEQFNNLFKKYQIKDYLFQEYIKASHGHDLRVFVINNRVTAAVRREGKSDFRANLSLGGKGTVVKLSKKQKNTALKVASLLHGECVGLDFLLDGDKLIFCEVNTAPQNTLCWLPGHELDHKFEFHCMDLINDIFDNEFGYKPSKKAKLKNKGY
ncbi:MAG: RimK family alpha-L-glutamate ligase [Firmicutes bacterium]|nr:RimK family alpha-L-glutamate ligase [Bacillota bacterium]